MNEMLVELRSIFSLHSGLTDQEDETLSKQLQSVIEQLTNQGPDTFRTAHAQLSGLLHEQGILSLPFLLHIFANRFQTLSNLRIRKVPKSVNLDIGAEEFLALVKRCLLFQPKGEIHLFTYRMPDISPLSSKDVLPLIRSMLNHSVSNPLDPKDLATILNLLGMSRRLSLMSNQIDETYIQFESILQRLFRDGHQQLARDNAEEAMICAYADGVPELGHYCRFSLYTSQRNPIDAALHGCLLAMTLQSLESITDAFHTRLLIATFTFYRNIGFFDLATSLHDKIMSLPSLGEYERQHITMAFLNMLLIKQDPDVLNRANAYVELNLEAIEAFGKASLVPWLAMICNLKSMYPQKYAAQTALIALESYIDTHLPIDEGEQIKDQILRHRSNSKEFLRESLDKLTQSRNKSDHVYEVNLLQVTASRVIETSLATGDIEGILLGHQAKSDGSLAFDLAESLPQHTLIRHDRETLQRGRGHFKGYLNQTQRRLLVHPDYRYVWLGFQGGKAYYLINEGGRFVAHGYIPGCTQSSVKDWLKGVLPDLGFEDSPPGQGPFRIREDIWREESKRIQNSIPKFHLPKSNRSTVLFSDVEMSCFPHNFLFDLTGNSQPQIVCSPLSLDHYMRCSMVHLDLSKINIWAPLTENDYAIELAYSRIKECLVDHPVECEEGLLPTFKSKADVKLFICHGGRNREGGFTGLYPSGTKKYLTPSILGTGKVAVLFVCHGGHISSDFYARSFQTLAKTLLLSGYETVIAPAWSLNINIPGPWAEAFLQRLKSGQNIVSAACEANLQIKEIYPVESAWAAMHVFGNPHLKIRAT